MLPDGLNVEVPSRSDIIDWVVSMSADYGLYTLMLSMYIELRDENKRKLTRDYRDTVVWHGRAHCPTSGKKHRGLRLVEWLQAKGYAHEATKRAA